MKGDFQLLMEFFAYIQANPDPDADHEITMEKGQTANQWDVVYRYGKATFIADPRLAKGEIKILRDNLRARYARLSKAEQDKIGGFQEIENLFNGWESVADKCIRLNGPVEVDRRGKPNKVLMAGITAGFFAMIVVLKPIVWLQDLFRRGEA
jgi:hypothetical protein